MARVDTGDRRGPAANPKVQKRLEQQRNRLDREFADAIVATLDTPHGRRFLGEWLDGYSRLFQTSFDHSGSVMCFNEGQRNAGLQLLAKLEEVDAVKCELMLAELRERKRAIAREREAIEMEGTDGRN